MTLVLPVLHTRLPGVGFPSSSPRNPLSLTSRYVRPQVVSPLLSSNRYYLLRWELVRDAHLIHPSLYKLTSSLRAGIESTYGAQCGPKGPTGSCYADSVVGNGANFADAYFELDYLRVYTTGGVGPTPTPAVPGATLAFSHQTAKSAAQPLRPAFGASGEGMGVTWVLGMMVTLGLGWGAGMGLGWGMDGVAW